jgi:hypothetical protein
MVGGVLSVAVLITAAAACGGTGAGAKHPALPTWHAPVVTGGPSVANFCTLLVADVRHLSELDASADPAQAAQVLNEYVAAAPAIVAVAPPAIAPATRAYVAETATVYGALAASQTKSPATKSSAASSGLLGQFSSPQSVAAVDLFRGFAEQHCGFDPFNPSTAPHVTPSGG